MIKASQLRENKRENKELKKEIEDILSYIMKKIKEADSINLTSVVVDLPVIFLVEDIDNEKAKVIVYSAIIERLDIEEYKSRIQTVDDNTVRLHISWQEHINYDYQREILRRHQFR